MKTSWPVTPLRSLLLALVCALSATARAEALEAVPLSQYLSYARSSADWTWQHYDEIVQRWKASLDPHNVFGYRPPAGLLEMAAIDAYFYATLGRDEYAARAKKVLLTYDWFRREFPEWARKKRPDYEDGLPALPDFFTVMRYIRAFDLLQSKKALEPQEVGKVETVIAESMDYLLRTQEWGAMNRAALRAESLAWALRVLPGHPKAKTWEMQRQALGNDNWGTWEIEDATIYHGVWLYALCGCADARDEMSALFKTPVMYYYAHYFLQLMSPAGMVPDFGDAHWNASWPLYLVFFESAAKAYGDAGMKWAAATIARTFIDFKNPTNVGLGYNLLDCVRWGTDGLKPAPPSNLSGEVLEDVQGKKIVFRTGWDSASTYLLLNYRDEGDGGLLFRDYLRDTIPVEEEKMTHGHADENSLVLLMSSGSVLLHDAGYRDFMPSGPFGAYRQDYFHNRLCVRPEKIFFGQAQDEFRYSTREAVQGQGLLDFLRNAGSYRRVRTQKVDFLTFDDFDYSRTRLIDDHWGYAHDRVVVFLKDPEVIVVFDILKALKEEFYTLASLWHTRQVVARGEHWYETRYDRIQDAALPAAKNLLILFPPARFHIEGLEPLKRHYQDEWVLHQTAAQHFELAETAALATVLIPHPSVEPPEDVLRRIRILPSEEQKDVVGLRVQLPDREIIIAAKTDLRKDMARDWRRPRYTYEAGKIAFGGFETNGDLLVGHREGLRLRYTVVNLTRALFEGRPLFEAKSWMSGLAFNGSPDQAGFGKLRYWRDEVNLDRPEE